MPAARLRRRGQRAARRRRPGSIRDRFLLHVFVEPVPDNRLEDLLAGGWAAARHKVTAIADLASLDVLNQAVPQVDMEGVRLALAQAIRLLRQAQVQLSDRRIVKAQRLIAAAAVLAGRTPPPRRPVAAAVCDTDRRRPAQRARNPARTAGRRQPSAAAAVVEQAAQQPMARLARLLESADLLLADGGGERVRSKRCLREIDANSRPHSATALADAASA